MAFHGPLSQSNGLALGLSGSVIIADRSGSKFPSMPGTDVKFFVSGTNKTNDESGVGPFSQDTIVLGGDTVISGAFIVAADNGQASYFGFRSELDMMDNIFYVSGAIGKRGISTEFGGGSAVFGGDVVSSGAMYFDSVGSSALSTQTSNTVALYARTQGGQIGLYVKSGSTETKLPGGGGGGGGGISFNGSTANGLVTYGGATTADVESNFTFDGTDATIEDTGKINFNDTGTFIHSPSDGDLKLSGDGAAEDAILIAASNAAGGISLTAGTGGITSTLSGIFAVTSSVNNANGIQMFASAGGMAFGSSGAAGEDIDIKNIGGSINIIATEDDAAAIVLYAGNGGVDIGAGGAAGEDIDISNSAGSVNISAGETASDSVKVSGTGVQILASNTTHGLKLANATTGVPITIGHTVSETTIGDNLTVTGNTTLAGDLIVQGSTTTVSSSNMIIEDSIIGLGVSGSSGGDWNNVGDRGIIFARGASASAELPGFWWDGSNFNLAISTTSPTSGSFSSVSTGDWSAVKAGNLLPGEDDTYDLGSASLAWKDLHLEGDITMTDGGTISTTSGNLVIDAAGTLTMDTDGTDAINLGTEAVAKEITIGNDASTAVDINALDIQLDAGSGGYDIDGAGNSTLTTSGTGTLTINSAGKLTIDTDGTDDIDLGVEAVAKEITIGNAASTAVNVDALAVTVTSVNALSVTDGAANLAYDGAGAVVLTSVGYDHNASGAITIDSSGGTIGIGTDDINQAINIGTNGNRAITIGENGNSSSGVAIHGEAGITLDAGSNDVGLTGDIMPSADNTYNLGSTTMRFANIYTGDLHLRNDRGNWTMIEEPSYLSLTNNDTGKVYKILMEEVTDDSPNNTSGGSAEPTRSTKKNRSL